MKTEQFLDEVNAIAWPLVKITFKDGSTKEGYLDTQNCFTWYLSFIATKPYEEQKIKLYPSKIKKIEVMKL